LCFHAGIGALTALKLIQKHGSLASVLESLDKTKYQIPEPFPYEIAKGLFKGIPLSY
jgi:flap endonuclease-1